MSTILENQFFVLLGLILLASGLLGWFLFDVRRKVAILFGDGSKGGDLQKDLIRRLARTEANLEEIEPRLNLVEEISKVSVQKVGFLRFNPFDDTGGDNSFILAMLDRKNEGILLTSLYSRGGMRIYAKRVEKGKTKQQLSEEEHKILEETTRK